MVGLPVMLDLSQKHQTGKNEGECNTAKPRAFSHPERVIKHYIKKEGYAKLKINCSYGCENHTGNTPTGRLQSEKTALSPLGTNVHVQAIILCRAHVNRESTVAAKGQRTLKKQNFSEVSCMSLKEKERKKKKGKKKASGIYGKDMTKEPLKANEMNRL